MHKTLEQLVAEAGHVRAAPADRGILDMIVIRRDVGERKFSSRYGADALRWVNSPEGKPLRLRDVNARVVEPGVVRMVDVVAKLA